ncbi:MAG: CCA tRNA nucleotidyltransferase [Clostridium sp.]
MFVPEDVKFIIDNLYKNGYEGFLVGGCVRDSILNKTPNDYDITTSAKPEITKKIFENLNCKVIETGIKHGTVTVVLNKKSYEITTYRIEGEYLDNRRPSEVFFTDKLEEDLKRRDFTINAMAYNEYVGLLDFFGGKEDLKNKIIKAIGNAKDRFNEDGLRMLRAVRFSTQLEFSIDINTLKAIKNKNNLIKNISMERINEEFKKILLSNVPSTGIRQLVDLGLINYIIPEIVDMVGFEQKNKYHDKDVFNHTMKVLDGVSCNLQLRLAALFHDIAKPRTFSLDEKGGHFYFHEVEGMKLCENILKRLKFDNKTIEVVKLLVKNHMRVLKGNNKYKIRKYIGEVGYETLDLIFDLMIADRLASHKEYRNYDDVLKMKKSCMEVLEEKEPLTTKELNFTGKDIIEMGISKGKEVGEVLNYLLDLVLQNPKINTKETLRRYALKYIHEK